MAVEVETSHIQICDDNGDPLSGAKVYVYDVTTTNLKTVYSNTGLSISVSNPIVTDSAGRHDMRYIATGSYKIVVKTSADVPVYTRDNIDGRVPVGAGALGIVNGGTGATSAGAALTALGGATAAELADIAADVAALSGAVASSEKTHIATGTTAQRPGSPADGDFRRNTTIPQWEGYNGSGWKYLVTEEDVGTSGAVFGRLNANKTDSATNSFTGANTFSNAAGIAAPNTVKAFVNFQGNGTVTVNSALNVTSVTDNGVGDYTINFTSALSTTGYSVIGSAQSAGANVNIAGTAAGAPTTKTTTACRIIVSVGAVATDCANVSVMFLAA